MAKGCRYVPKKKKKKTLREIDVFFATVLSEMDLENVYLGDLKVFC